MRNSQPAVCELRKFLGFTASKFEPVFSTFCELKEALSVHPEILFSRAGLEFTKSGTLK
jgi:hypothetical protein